MIAKDTLEIWSYENSWDLLSGLTYDQFCKYFLCARKICVFCYYWYSIPSLIHMGFPGDSVAKDYEAVCQWRRCRFDPWAGKIPWIRKCQPTPFNIQVFFSGKSHGQRSLVGLQSMGSQRVRHDLATKQHYIYVYICIFI